MPEARESINFLTGEWGIACKGRLLVDRRGGDLG